MTIEIRRESNPRKLTDQLTEIYAAAFAPPPYKKSAREAQSFGLDFPNMVRRIDFRLIVAWDGKLPVGFAYGYHLRPQYGWQQVLGPPLKKAGHAEWLEDAFCMAELALRPDYWGQGIGGRLHDALFADLPYSRFILSTMQNDTTNAYQMYRKRGWIDLLENYFVSAIDREYRVMGKISDLVEREK